MVVSGLFVVWVWCVFGKASHPSNETKDERPLPRTSLAGGEDVLII